MSSHTRSSKGGTAKSGTGAAGKRPSKIATVKDLHDEERKKYDDAIQSALRLEEEKQDLNEQCDAKDEQITHFQRQFEEEMEKGSANAARLTEIITALEDQRVEAFELLQVYQQRIEQLSETIRKYEKDEMGGERKKTMLASIASLEELVASQKGTIQSQDSDRASLLESHKGELGVLQNLVDERNKEVEEKRAALDRSEKRCAAVEMACARLTKQITDMHRRDGVKSAEIDALKKLLTDRVIVSGPLESSSEKDKVSHEEEQHNKHGHGHSHSNRAHTASPPTYDQEGHVHVHMPHYKRHSLSAGHMGTVSPKRKLSDALETGRGGMSQGPFQKDRDNEDFLASADKDTGRKPVATKKTPQQQAAVERKSNNGKSFSPGPRDGRVVKKKVAGGGDVGGTGSRLARTETKSRVVLEAAVMKEREISAERKHHAEVQRRKLAREKNAKLRNIKAVDIISPSPSPARAVSTSVGARRKKVGSKDKEDKRDKDKDKGESIDVSTTTRTPVTDASTATNGGVAVVKQGTLTKKVSVPRGRVVDKRVAAKTPLKVVLGERKQYDPALFTLVSSLDGQA